MTPGEGFRDVTLYDVTPLMKIMSKVGEDQKKNVFAENWVGFDLKVKTKKKGLRRKLSAFSVQINDGDQIK